ncbi:MAG: LUD domain-containing protein [bacterium]|nr:LUD domain-containing protein [bacterium]
MNETFVTEYLKNRQAAVGSADEALRQKLHELKKSSVARLPELVEKAKKSLEANGVKVYLAKDNAEAGAILNRLLEGTHLAVKSKSNLITELRQDGSWVPARQAEALAGGPACEIVETDIGDFLAEICQERTDHPVLPALNLTREKTLFALSKKYPQEEKALMAMSSEQLVRFLSSKIREKILAAEVGLTGANAITAEGQIMLVENEGNISLISRIPLKHVVVAGIEKVAETAEDALHVAHCAAVWGTGQPWTSYVNFISGPAKTADLGNELVLGAQGAKEVHLILVDDWRSSFVGEGFEEMLYCINCGACENTCPVFLTEGTAVKILDPEKNYLCATCGACTLNCPAGIDWRSLTTLARQKHAAANLAPPAAKTMLEKVQKFGNPFGEKVEGTPKELYCC